MLIQTKFKDHFRLDGHININNAEPLKPNVQDLKCLRKSIRVVCLGSCTIYDVRESVVKNMRLTPQLTLVRVIFQAVPWSV